MSEADVGGMALRLNLPTNTPLQFVAMWQMAAEGHCGRMVSDMEEHMEQRCGIEFLYAEKMADIFLSLNFSLVNMSSLCGI